MSSMKAHVAALVLVFSMALAMPTGAWAQTLDQAAAKAARQYNAKVLSARTVQKGNRRVHVIKLLTRDGVVKTVRIPVRGSAAKTIRSPVRTNGVDIKHNPVRHVGADSSATVFPISSHVSNREPG